jgi:DNA-binding transcriptional MerR regulator
VAKSPDAFRTISEAADELGVPQHVLRFWETKFSFIRPMKRAGGRRFYRRQDIEVLKSVRALLHEQGYTIKGVQRLHKERGVRHVLAAGSGEAQPPEALAPEAELPEALSPEAAAAEPAPADAAAPSLLSEAARGRLSTALQDLEGVKARIDALLGGRG